MNEVSTELLRENGYISFVDVQLRMGKLAKEDHEAWRLGTIPYLERAIRLNLSQLKYMLHTLKDNARKGGLRPRGVTTGYLTQRSVFCRRAVDLRAPCGISKRHSILR